MKEITILFSSLVPASALYIYDLIIIGSTHYLQDNTAQLNNIILLLLTREQTKPGEPITYQNQEDR